MPIVTATSGTLSSYGCYLTWTLYRVGTKKVIDTKSGSGCDSMIFLGQNRAIPVGQYRLHMKVETDSGQEATGVYAFTAADVPW
ncbi:hypothetical protein [Kribbella sp. NPDC000426]|uniref:hypothetical protein n=1 Tax=Kribbella sp. NPDC000426 TaxID=3154255 RepID=UPI0033335684